MVYPRFFILIKMRQAYIITKKWTQAHSLSSIPQAQDRPAVQLDQRDFYEQKRPPPSTTRLHTGIFHEFHQSFLEKE